MSEPEKIMPPMTRAFFAAQIESSGWEVGEHSYGQPRVLDPQYARLRIGRFCSIGPEVTIVLGNHRTDLVTTYPFKTLAHLWPEAGAGEEDHEARGDVVIGHDVWIGAGAMILPGTEIGHGAVVAGHAVVRGKVPPYAIVAGNPGKVVRHRFAEDVVARLLAAGWWDWEEAVLRARLPLMMSGDIETFLMVAETISA